MFRELGLGPDARPLPRTPIAHDGWQLESPFNQLKHRGLARYRGETYARQPTAVTTARHRGLAEPDYNESANPLMSRIVAADTSGSTFRKIISPAWQVPLTVRL